MLCPRAAGSGWRSVLFQLELYKKKNKKVLNLSCVRTEEQSEKGKEGRSGSMRLLGNREMNSNETL